MYSSTGNNNNNGKTMIRVGGGNNKKSEMEPLYSVPIQTTATFNIQLLMQRRSPATSSTSTNQIFVSNPGTTSTTIGLQTIATSRPPSTNLNFIAEVGPTSARTNSASTQYDDVMASCGGYSSSVMANPPPGYSVGGLVTTVDKESLAVSSSGPTAPWGSDSFGNSSSGSITTTSAAGSTASSRSESSFSTSSASTMTSPDSMWADGSSSGSLTSNGSVNFNGSTISGGSTSCASDSTSTSALGGAAKGPMGEPEVDGSSAEGYRVFSDAAAADRQGGAQSKSDRLGHGLETTMVWDADDSTRSSLTGGGGAGAGADDGDGKESDDSDSEGGWENLERPEKMRSTFNVIEWNVNDDKSKFRATCNRVIIIKDRDMVLMLKANCLTEKVGNDRRLLSLMADIAENCTTRLRRMKTLPDLCAEHMDTLPLSDGRPTKDHLNELSSAIGEKVSIKEVAYRFQPPEDIYLGTFVQKTVLSKRNYAIGKAGVVAVLAKKSKYATVEAFSEQLCEHIAVAQPTCLGRLTDAELKRLNRKGTTRIRHLQKDQLLIQNFLFDQTIIVAEAARRSFVRIEDFLLFK